MDQLNSKVGGVATAGQMIASRMQLSCDLLTKVVARWFAGRFVMKSVENGAVLKESE